MYTHIILGTAQATPPPQIRCTLIQQITIAVNKLSSVCIQ